MAGVQSLSPAGANYYYMGGFYSGKGAAYGATGITWEIIAFIRNTIVITVIFWSHRRNTTGVYVLPRIGRYIEYQVVKIIIRTIIATGLIFEGI